MNEGIDIIRQYKHMVPAKISKQSMFRLYIDFGEKYLQEKNYGQAFRKFNKAWLHKPLSIIPAKKIAKTLLHFLRG